MFIPKTGAALLPTNVEKYIPVHPAAHVAIEESKCIFQILLPAPVQDILIAAPVPVVLRSTFIPDILELALKALTRSPV